MRLHYGVWDGVVYDNRGTADYKEPDDTRYLGGNKNSSVNAIKLQGRPRTGIISKIKKF